MDETTKTPEPETIYVVVGDDGECDDHVEWIVAWYPDKATAQAHADAATAEVKRIHAPREEWERALGPHGYTTGRSPPYPDPLPADRRFDKDISDTTSYSVATINRGKWPFDLPPRGEMK